MTDEELFGVFSSQRETPVGQNAFAKLVDRYYRQGVETLSISLRDYHTAEDVVQDVFRRLLLSELIPGSSFQNWFFWRLRVGGQDALRRRRTRRATTNYYDERPLGDLVQDNSPPPEIEFELNEFREKFWEFVDTLNPKQKRTVLGVLVDRDSYSDIAREFGETPKCTRFRFFYLRDRLLDLAGEPPVGYHLSLNRRESARSELSVRAA